MWAASILPASPVTARFASDPGGASPMPSAAAPSSMSAAAVVAAGAVAAQPPLDVTDSERMHINLLACLQLHLRCCPATGVRGAQPAASQIVLVLLVSVTKQLDVRCRLRRACASHLLLAALVAAALLALLPAAVLGWPGQTGPHPHPPSGEQAAALTCNTTGVGLLAAMQTNSHDHLCWLLMFRPHSC